MLIPAVGTPAYDKWRWPKRVVEEPIAPRPPTSAAARIVSKIARKHRFYTDDLRSALKTKQVVLARQEAFYMLDRKLDLSSREIGRLLNREHSSVLHGIRRHEERIKRGEVRS